VLTTDYTSEPLTWLSPPPRSVPTTVALNLRGTQLGHVAFFTDGEPLMRPGEMYVFVTSYAGKVHVDRGAVYPVARLRVTDGRVFPVAGVWLRSKVARELNGVTIAEAAAQILPVTAERERRRAEHRGLPKGCNP
jgi:hypothetical protein